MSEKESMVDQLEREDILAAAANLARTGIDEASIFNNYYVETEYGEFPFLQVVRLALEKKLSRKVSKQEVPSFLTNREVIESLGFPINYYKENISFFDTGELSLYASVAGQPYRKDDAEARRISQLLKPLVRKVNKWTELSMVDDYEYRPDNSWQWSGTFKSYLWIRIFRKNENDKAFFVFGVNKDGDLYLELNCLRSNHTAGTTEALSKETIDKVDQYLATSNYQRKIISRDNLKHYNWDMLVEESSNYLLENAALYDEISAIVTELEGGKITTKPPGKNTLLFEKPPRNTQSRAQRTKAKTTFKGREVDWGKRQEASIQLGSLGEQLVIRHEKEKLLRLGKPDLADQVKKVLDGEGYDIKSFEEDKTPRYIEVKTTVKGKEEPFQITLNELRYAELHRDNYVIYRLFEFQVVSETARCFEMSGSDLEKARVEPVVFEVSLK
jgi:hypothetical protein